MSNNTKFKVGQVWRARNGGLHTITSVSQGTAEFPYPVASADYNWAPDGRFDLLMIGPRPLDLVELIEDVADPVTEKPKPQFRVGQVWRARDGSSHTIAEISPQNVAFPVASVNYTWTLEGKAWVTDSHPNDLVELIEDAPEPKPSPSYTVATLERFALAETLSDYDHPDHASPYHAVLKRLNGEPPAGDQAGFAEWEATGRAKLKVLRAKALLAVLEAEGGEA